MRKRVTYPDWVEKYRKPGTNIAKQKDKYYLYEVTSKWDKDLGRARKITKAYLGRITEEGLIPPKKKQIKVEEKIVVKQVAESSVHNNLTKDILDNLNTYFPDIANKIYTIALIRAVNPCAFNKVATIYKKSYISEEIKDLAISPLSITRLLSSLGNKREQIKSFMNSYFTDDDYIMFDGTNITSGSKELEIAAKGYNSKMDFNDQINLLYAFSHNTNMPVYYRVIPGNIRDITAFEKTVSESGLKNVCVIADKGFASNNNFELIKNIGLEYIIPLRRNSTLYNKDILESNNLYYSDIKASNIFLYMV